MTTPITPIERTPIAGEFIIRAQVNRSDSYGQYWTGDGFTNDETRALVYGTDKAAHDRMKGLRYEATWFSTMDVLDRTTKAISNLWGYQAGTGQR